MFVKGHKLGRGNSNSGRKSLAEEIAKVKEKITQEALVELANKKVFAAINGAENHKQIKEIALPITLKGMTDKSENTFILPKPILNAIFSNNSNSQNSETEKENKSDTRGNVSEQDGINNLIPDTLIPER